MVRVLHTQTSRGFSWRITTQVRGHGGEDSVERDVDLEFRRPGETYWHPAESYREETGRDIPSRVAREYESNARAFADRPRSAHGRRLNPMTLSVKGRRVRVHSLGKGIRFPQRAWPSEAAILAHSLKQAKRIHRTYGEAWTNPRRRRNPPYPKSKFEVGDRVVVTRMVGDLLSGEVTAILKKSKSGDPTSGFAWRYELSSFRPPCWADEHVLARPTDERSRLVNSRNEFMRKYAHRARSNPLRRMSKRQALRRERLKWRSLSKDERKRIHREETVEVRDIYRNPRRHNPESKLPRTCPVGRLQELNLRGRSDANRIALKAGRRWDDDTIIKVFTDRKVMAVTVRMQQRSGPDGVPKWVPIIPLSDSEGYYR